MAGRFVAQICNLMIQLVIFKKLLLNPVKKVIAERKAKADSQIADAQKLRTEAEAMKAEYEQNLQNARTEANQIVAAAQKTATARSEELLGEARAQAAALKQKAEADIAQETQKGRQRGQGRDRRHGHGDRLQGRGARDPRSRPQRPDRRIYQKCG